MRRPAASLLVWQLVLLVLKGGALLPAEGQEMCSGIVPMKTRAETVSIRDFGGVGDGKTLNTAAFQRAIAHIERICAPGGTVLSIPAGVWLTGAFNLTSNMTLFLEKDSVIKATQDVSNWPLINFLPSYGRGRELPGGRYMSLIHGDGISDVIITGENGTIDGQGDMWWNMWRNKTLLFTRPGLLELMNSGDVIISNLVFLNSPFWNIHPVYCSNVVVRNVTVLAPHDSPNTDGVDPDSSSNVCIEDCYMSTGDDLVAVKSGWDEYGIAFARPSSDITVRRIAGSNQFAGIAVGSETSGGVENVWFEDVNVSNSGIGIHIKTNSGRGGFIRNITVTDVNMYNVTMGLRITGKAGDHPDDGYDPNALPVVDGLTIRNVQGAEIRQPGSITGIDKAPFTRITLSNVKFQSMGGQQVPWACADVSGVATGVQPSPCPELNDTRAG